MEDPWDQVRYGQHCGNWFVQILGGFLVCFSVRFHSCSDDMFSCSLFLVVQFLFYFILYIVHSVFRLQCFGLIVSYHKLSVDVL